MGRRRQDRGFTLRYLSHSPDKTKPSKDFRAKSAVNARPGRKDDATAARVPTNSRLPRPCPVHCGSWRRPRGVGSRERARAGFTRMTESGGEGRPLLPFLRAKSRPLTGKGQSQGLLVPAAGIGPKIHKTGRVAGHVTERLLRHVTEAAASLNLGFICGGKGRERPRPKTRARDGEARGLPRGPGLLRPWAGSIRVIKASGPSRVSEMGTAYPEEQGCPTPTGRRARRNALPM